MLFRSTALRSLGRAGLLLAVCVGVSSGSFMLALSYASVANVLFFQAVSPMLAALLAWVVLAERFGPRTLAAILLAAVGVVVMVSGSLDAGFLGVVLPLVCTFSFALVIVVARYRQDVSMLPATCASQGLVVLVVGPFASLGTASRTDWVVFAVLGVFQMGVGLALFTIGARLLPPAEVALIKIGRAHV